MNKIIRNRIMCRKCGDMIESEHRHGFKSCPCGAALLTMTMIISAEVEIAKNGKR